MTDSVHFASEPARANLRVSGFLHAAKALLFFAAGATPERSVFFFNGAATSSSTAAAATTGAEDDDEVVNDLIVPDDAALGATTAAAVRDGSVSGPVQMNFCDISDEYRLINKFPMAVRNLNTV